MVCRNSEDTVLDEAIIAVVVIPEGFDYTLNHESGAPIKVRDATNVLKTFGNISRGTCKPQSQTVAQKSGLPIMCIGKLGVFSLAPQS